MKPIFNLSASKKREMLSDLYYLNTGELHRFCDKHAIPYKILIESETGKTTKTRDIDRKVIVIDRVKHYLKTGEILAATLFGKDIVRLSGLPENITPNDRLFYGCYEKKNPNMIGMLKNLTDGEFKNGAIARILCRQFWTRGEAPTFEEYAQAWLLAKQNYSLKQHPEAAYLTDLARGEADSNWKEKRKKKARRVLEFLDKILDVD